MGEWWDWEVLATQITCTVSPEEVAIGGTITVTGSIEPSVPGAAVTLTYSKPDGSMLKRTVTAGPDGVYWADFDASEVGRWTVEASWDPGHSASESRPGEFIVTAVEEPRKGGGIPGFPAMSVALGLIAGALLLLRLKQGSNQREMLG